MNRSVGIARSSALAVIATLLLAVPAAAEEVTPTSTTALIVALDPSAAAVDVQDVVDEPGIVDEQSYGNLSTISVDTDSVRDVVAELGDDPRVAYVERDVEARIVATPADPFYSQQWGVPLAQVPSVWDTTTGSSSVVVAVIDTGVNPAHSDLAGAAFAAGYDFVNQDTTPQDDNGHGTAAIGVIASQHNATGTAGVCPRCQIMPLKAMDASGTGSHGAIAAAIHHAVDNGADIINLSLGSEASTTTLHNAVRRAHAAGILVVAAAGNAGVQTPFYPAAYPESLGVAASDSSDARYSWSNYGSWVSLAAPGCNFTAGYAPATDLLGYTNFCGTSSAAPFAAGVAGLLASAYPGTAGPALTTALQTTALTAPFVAAGRVNATGALAALAAPAAGGGAIIDGGGATGGGGGGGGGVLPPPDDSGTIEDPVEDGPAETATSVNASATSLAYGESVEIAGQVSSSSGSTQGAMVTLLGRPAGQSDWLDLAEQPADAAGGVVFTRRPEHTGDYRLRFDGSTAQTASLSDIVTITVHPVLTATSAAEPVLTGRAAVVTGTVLPARDGIDLVLQRRTATGWRAVDSGDTDAAGDFRLAAPARVGKSRYRVVAQPTNELAGEQSNDVVAVGERVKIPRVREDARGDDRRNLNGEFIVLRNTGKTTIQLRGWTVRSRSTRATFSLPSYRLRPGATVKLRSGKGRSGSGEIYLTARREVWRNRRDVAVVRHSGGGVAERISW